MLLHVSSTRVHRQEAKIVLYNLWYHHTETSKRSKITKITKIAKIQFHNYEHIVVNLMCEFFGCDYCVLVTVIITPEKFTHKFDQYVFIFIELNFSNFSYFSNFRPLTCFSVMIPEVV